MQESDVSFLSPEYLDILENSDKILQEFKEQPREMEFIHSTFPTTIFFLYNYNPFRHSAGYFSRQEQISRDKYVQEAF
jgi:hypothetical protein